MLPTRPPLTLRSLLEYPRLLPSLLTSFVLVLYLLFMATKSHPVYHVSPPAPIRLAGQSLCLSTVALWNEYGHDIGYFNRTPEEATRITAAPGHRIVSIEQSHAARPSLVLLPTIETTDPPVVTLAIEAGDRIAAGEGAAFRILFTGDCATANLAVRGRVSRSPDEVQPYRIPPAFNNGPAVRYTIAVILTVLAALIAGQLASRLFLRICPARYIDRFNNNFLLLSAFLVVAIVATALHHLDPILRPGLPAWLNL